MHKYRSVEIRRSLYRDGIWIHSVWVDYPGRKSLDYLAAQYNNDNNIVTDLQDLRF